MSYRYDYEQSKAKQSEAKKLICHTRLPRLRLAVTGLLDLCNCEEPEMRRSISKKKVATKKKQIATLLLLVFKNQRIFLCFYFAFGISYTTNFVCFHIFRAFAVIFACIFIEHFQNCVCFFCRNC